MKKNEKVLIKMLVHSIILILMLFVAFPSKIIYAKCIPPQCITDSDCPDIPPSVWGEYCVANCCVPRPRPGCSSNSDCNDNLFCTNDTCNTSTGACSHTAKSCDDSNSCTTDSCNETTDSCTHTNNPVNGGWSAWGACVNCSQSRTCTNPAPSCGGAQCSGPSTQSCGLVDGSLGAWGTCTGGSQASTCTGFLCGGNCSTACSNAGGTYNYTTNICTRSCLSIEGYIWSDDNNDNSKQNSENFKSSALSGCSTSKIFNSFNMSITSEVGNQISSWWCHGTNGAYYTTPNSAATKSIEPESTKTISLTTIPSGYKYKSWEFRYSKDGVETSKTGTGSIASSLSMPAYANWVNLHWRLDQQKYTLKLKVKKIPVELTDTLGLCSSSGFNGFENMSGANVTIKNLDGNIIPSCSGTTNAMGEFSCPIWVNQGEVSIEVRKDVGGDTPETYTMKCPAVGLYKFTPSPPPSEGQTININIGLQTIYKKGWVSSIDADIFANNLNVVVPDGPTDNSSSGQIYNGFAKTLINSSSNNNNTLGFVFSHSNNKSNPDVDRPCPNRKGFETNTGCGTEYGGYAYDLMHSSQDHKSIWLENFSFSPPSSAKKISSLPTTFNSGSIYSISSSVFNNRLKSEAFSYSIIGDGGNGMSVLYIDGNANILNPITTSSSGRLLLVVDGSLTVGSSVGSVMDSFSLTQNPNIMAGIISSGQVTIASIGGTISDSHFDKPIMLTAPFVSKTGISFGRDLYHDNNAKLPAEAVNFFGKYLYYISNLEKTKSADYLYYTGVSTYDISWEYIY